MNPRLLHYLRSLGLKHDATEEEAWEFVQNLRGLQANVANCLNYNDADQQARTNCDLMIRAIGYDPSDPTRLLPQQRELPGDDGASVDGDLEAVIEAARQEGILAEQKRVSEIQELSEMAGTDSEIIRQLVDDPQITVATARKRILEDHRQRTRASVTGDRPGVPAIHVRGGMTVEVLEAAVLFQRNLDPMTQWARNVDDTPRLRRPNPELERYAELAWPHRSASVADMIRECAKIDGIHNLPTGSKGLLRAYIEGMHGRSFSTSALSAIFTTSVNSELLASFNAAGDTTTGGWVRESDVSDFKTNERATLLNGGALQKLPRGGTADHADYEDVVETYKIARYAKQFVIDEQDVIDDNFGGITGFVPSDMGVAARQLRPDMVYSILMGNPTMRDSVALFHANHGNLNTSSALGGSTLEAARKAMRIQTENGRNLNIMPRFLIVPPALEDTADVLINSRILITGENLTKPENNPNYNKGLVIVTDARLENGVTDPTDGTGATAHAGSTTTWFLLSTANNHTIEVGYLRGSGRVPQIRSFVLDRGQWGMGWDVKMDIGAKALDWLGMAKCTA